MNKMTKLLWINKSYQQTVVVSRYTVDTDLGFFDIVQEHGKWVLYFDPHSQDDEVRYNMRVYHSDKDVYHKTLAEAIQVAEEHYEYLKKQQK